MSANAIRQVPGWWASLVRAECDSCDWVGPTRNLDRATGRMLAELDKREHTCERI